ncbi:hypothetical protein MMC16_004711 [Acarospora aff. strigata]|nr:hypothetical protein [Acarospora aff. strigata]
MFMYATHQSAHITLYRVVDGPFRKRCYFLVFCPTTANTWLGSVKPFSVQKQCHPSRISPLSWLRLSKNPLIQPPLHDDVPSAADDSWQNAVFYHWLDIIEDYTRRNLRCSSDTFPALSGLASRAQKTLNGSEYLAGLWQSHMPYALVWVVRGDNRGRRPSGNGAPSWLWASVTGPAGFGDPYQLPREETFAEVLSSSIAHVDPNPFGAVDGGKLEIRGGLKQAGRLEKGRYGYLVSYTENKGTGVMDYDGSFRFDDHDDMSRIIDGVLWCLKSNYNANRIDSACF